MSKCLFADIIPMKGFDGFLTIKRKYSDGREEVVFEEDKNRITNAAKLLMFSYLWDTEATIDPLTTVRVGDGGTTDPEGRIPKVPTGLETGLSHQLISIPVYHTVNSSIPSVTFIGNLDESLGNSVSYSEAGLFTQSGIIFSIKNFVTVPKTSDFTLSFEWTIRYV